MESLYVMVQKKEMHVIVMEIREIVPFMIILDNKQILILDIYLNL